MPRKTEKQENEQATREKGKTIPLYARNVVKAMSRPKQGSKVTPSKRG